MSRFFPHADYAEDQRFPHAILAYHCLVRGATTGAVLGAGIFGGQALYRSLLSSAPRTAPPAPAFSQGQLLLRFAGIGTAVGAALLGVAMLGRMRGREPIEWSDRSWRLTQNLGQLEVDDWTLGGALAGVGVAAAVGALNGTGWSGVVGAAGGGTVVGTVGYMAWRYGVMKGKFGE